MPQPSNRTGCSFVLAVVALLARAVICCRAQTLPASTQPATRVATATTAPTTSPTDDHQAVLQAAQDMQIQAYTTEKPADYKAAAAAMEQCVNVMPDNAKLQRELGFLYLKKLHDAERAYPHLDRAYAIDPNDADWALLLATAAGQLGKNDRQLQLINDVLKADPSNEDAKAALAALTPATNPAPPATTESTQPAATIPSTESVAATAPAPSTSPTQPAPSTAPTTAPAAAPSTAPTTAATAPSPDQTPLQKAMELQAHAYTTDAAADYRAAADALEQCSKADPANLEVERSLGYLWLDKLKDSTRAYPHLENAWKLNATDAGWGSLLARAAGDTGRSDRQMQVLRQVAREHSGDAIAHLELAQALDKAGAHGEAGYQFSAALKLSPDDENIQLAYAQHLHDRGQDQQARSIVDAVLLKNPSSAVALALRGDILRADWELDDAQAAYQQSLASNPYSEAAKTGVTDIHHSRAPTLETSYYYFAGSDRFYQQGLYNSLSFSASPHVYLSAGYNMGYFRNDTTKYGSVLRYQETLGIEDRVNSAVSVRTGVEAFQQPEKEAFGFTIAGTWKPINEFWLDASYKTNDPVTDSMFTVANGLSQDILGITSGWQATDDLSVKVTASRSVYSDDSVREFVHVEPACTIWRPAQLRVGAQYEAYRYSKAIPGAGGPDWYQTYGPVVELEPTISSWLSVHARAEFPYVAQASQWGTNLNLEVKFHPDDHLEAKAGVFYVHVPESISSYSGTGFDASLSYRF
jgi:tetratricopeptide (TPR) repeat protein